MSFQSEFMFLMFLIFTCKYNNLKLVAGAGFEPTTFGL
jgi:hypothetical protein